MPYTSRGWQLLVTHSLLIVQSSHTVLGQEFVTVALCCYNAYTMTGSFCFRAKVMNKVRVRGD